LIRSMSVIVVLLRCSVLVDKPSSMDSGIVIGVMASGNDNDEKTCSILILSVPRNLRYIYQPTKTVKILTILIVLRRCAISTLEWA
jgi:hypothetical protein